MATASDLRQKWSADRPAFGAWATIPSGFAAELMCAPGIDYVCIDQQHGLVDYGDMLGMVRGIEARGPVSLTRVPTNDAWLIGRALDAGLQGVIVPLVNRRAEAARAVAACRYPPEGVRSYGPVRSSMVMDSFKVEILGNGVLCFVMVETREGLERIDEIASTPGLDGVYVGPADLALGLGLPPELDKEEPEHVAAVASILAACRRHKVIPGIQCGSGASARRFANMGFRLVTFTKDSSILPLSVKKELAAARGDEESQAKQSHA